MPFPGSKVVDPRREPEVAAVLDQTKPELGDIYRRTSTKSAGGGDTETLTLVVSAVPVRIRAQGRRSLASSAGDQATEHSLRELSFPDGTNVRPTDRVIVGARTFDVEESGSESYDAELRVLCIEVTL